MHVRGSVDVLACSMSSNNIKQARVVTGARARALTLAREHERRMRPAGGAHECVDVYSC